MSIIRRVAVPGGETVPLLPPDGEDLVASYDWVIINPAGGADVDLVDAPDKTAGQGATLVAGGPPVRLVVGNDQVWAAAASGATLHIIGVAHE